MSQWYNLRGRHFAAPLKPFFLLMLKPKFRTIWVSDPLGRAKSYIGGDYPFNPRIDWSSKVEPDELTYGIEAVRNDLSPDILIDLNQSSGTTLPDISGNNRDFVHNGSEGVDFTWSSPSISQFPYIKGSLANGNTFGAGWVSDVEFSGAHTFLMGSQTDMTGTAAYFFDIQTDRLIMAGAQGGGGGWWYFDTAQNSSLYDGDLDNELMVGIVHDQPGTGLATLYANGLPMFTGPADIRTLQNSTQWMLFSRFNTSNTMNGDFEGFFMYKNRALSKEEVYRTWLRATRLEHYHVKYVQDTSLETGLVQAMPGWETDGTNAMDISGNIDHAQYISGPILAKPAIELYHKQAYYTDSTAYLLLTTTLDITTDDFSVSCYWMPYLTLTRAIFGIGVSGDYLRLIPLSGSLYIQIQFAGGAIDTASGATTIELDRPYLVSMTWDASAKRAKVYLNGVEEIDYTFSTSVPSTTGTDFVINGAPDTNRGFATWCSVYRWDRVLTDAEVLSLYPTDVPASPPPPTTRYLSSDLSGSFIPDSSGNGNGSAEIFGSPPLTDGAIVLDHTLSQWIGIEDGIAAAAQTSQQFTVSIVAFLENGDFVFSYNTVGGASNGVLIGLRNTGTVIYGAGLSFIAPNQNNHDRSLLSLALSVDTITEDLELAINGRLIHQGPLESTGPATLSATDLWSVGQEYDGAGTPSNFSSMSVYEVSLYDYKMDAGDVIDMSASKFDEWFRF